MKKDSRSQVRVFRKPSKSMKKMLEPLPAGRQEPSKPQALKLKRRIIQ